MNYSIMLLGATISVSLFIKICLVCGAIFVSNRASLAESIGSKSGQNPNKSLWNIPGYGDDPCDWPGPDADRSCDLRRVLKESQHSDSSGQHSDDYIDAVVDEWISQMEFAKAHSDRNPDNIPAPRHHNVDHICQPLLEEGVTENCQEDVSIIDAGEVPPGCAYTDDEETHLVCADQELTKLPPLPRELTYLDVMHTKIQRLGDEDFGKVNITYVMLLQNDLNTITPTAFQKIKSLTILQILHNKLQYLAYEMYVGLTEVQVLYLDYNMISLEIYKDCPIKPIEEITPVLPKLRYFSLQGNPLKIVPRQMWAGLRNSQLNTLDLSFCSLEAIHEESFSYLTKLAILNLSFNPKLNESTLTKAFKGLANSSLTKLYLMGNNLGGVPQEAIAYVKRTLNYLDLSKNTIEYLSPSSFSTEMTKLRTLMLDFCSIRSISQRTFDTMPNLVELSLTNNQLTEVPPAIHVLRGLRYLNFENNRGSNVHLEFKINSDAFENITNLYSMILTNVPIKAIRRTSFDSILSLQVLILDNADISSIEDGSFQHLKSMVTLQMQNNPLTTANSLSFYGMPKLENLVLNDCRLTFIPPSDLNYSNWIHPVDSSVKNYSASTPIIDAGIEVNPFSPFLYLPNLLRLELKNNKITKLFPELLRGPEDLCTLDLSGNSIESWNTPILRPNYRATSKDNNDEDDQLGRNFSLARNKLAPITTELIQDIVNFDPFHIDLSDNLFLCTKTACDLTNIILGRINSSDNYTGELRPAFHRYTWERSESYRCLYAKNETYFNIVELTEALCLEFEGKVGDDGSGGSGNGDSGDAGIPIGYANDPSSSSSIVIIAVSILCTTVLIAGAVLTGYRKRVHLKYMWFATKFQIDKVKPRKAKLSAVDSPNYSYDIFVSYHNSDRDFVQDQFLPEVEESTESSTDPKPKDRDIEVGSDVGSLGFRVCLHERDFEAGVPISENIVEAVDHSRKIVIILTKKYLESQWCTFEMNLAYHRLIESRRNSFILLLLEPIPVELRTKVLNYLMRSRTYLEWPGDRASFQERMRFWTRLKSSLSTID